MLVVLITPEAMLHKTAPYVDALKAAGLDVFEQEPPAATTRLFRLFFDRLFGNKCKERTADEPDIRHQRTESTSQPGRMG